MIRHGGLSMRRFEGRSPLKVAVDKHPKAAPDIPWRGVQGRQAI